MFYTVIDINRGYIQKGFCSIAISLLLDLLHNWRDLISHLESCAALLSIVALMIKEELTDLVTHQSSFFLPLILASELLVFWNVTFAAQTATFFQKILKT